MKKTHETPEGQRGWNLGLSYQWLSRSRVEVEVEVGLMLFCDFAQDKTYGTKN